MEEDSEQLGAPCPVPSQNTGPPGLSGNPGTQCHTRWSVLGIIGVTNCLEFAGDGGDPWDAGLCFKTQGVRFSAPMLPVC